MPVNGYMQGDMKMNWRLKSPDWIKNAADAVICWTAGQEPVSERCVIPAIRQGESVQYGFDKHAPWYEQVLELERKGKPTSISAHEIAMQAKSRAERGKSKFEEKSRVPGEDDEDDEEIPF